MLASRLSQKGQVTLPKEVRRALSLKAGDMVQYEIQDRGVLLKGLDPFDAAFHKALSATLDEWATPEDDEAFHDL